MIKRFDYLTEEERRIRTEVFVVEQGFNEEFDTIDDSCIHLIKYIDDKAVGVCRLYTDNEGVNYHIGRVAVDKSCRGLNIGRELIEKAEQIIVEEGGRISSLSAQTRVQGFYEKCGYTAIGDVYLDEHCPHIYMEKNLS